MSAETKPADTKPADKKSAAEKKGVSLWSPSGDCHVALTSGHTIVISGESEGTEIPPGKQHKEFVKQALLRGCVPVGMAAPDDPDEAGPDRQGVIKDKMRAMLASDDPTYFTSDGRPSLPVLSKMCGFNVDRGERDRLWKDIEADPDGDGA